MAQLYVFVESVADSFSGCAIGEEHMDAVLGMEWEVDDLSKDQALVLVLYCDLTSAFMVQLVYAFRER